MSSRIEFRISTEDYATLAKIASEHNMSPGQYARHAAMQSVNHALPLSKSDAIIEKMDNLLDKATTKEVLQYLNTHMPRLVYEYFQAQRAAQRGG